MIKMINVTRDGSSGGRAARERRDMILGVLETAGRVEVGDLAETLAVAEETVRRDLRALEEDGLLRRAHGGAIRVSPLATELNVMTSIPKPSHPIAQVAAQLLPTSGIVFVDSGLIAEALAVYLPDSTELQLVTTSVPVALIASRNPNLVVYNLGGLIDPSDGSQSGQWTREQLEGIRIDIAFVSTTGLTRDGYLTATTPKSAIVKRIAVEAAEKVVLIAEHEQLETAGLAKFARLQEIDFLVVDTETSDWAMALAMESGPQVLVAPNEAAS